MLETYFMNLDNTYNKLQTLSEYIDDTEDYVRFEIDTQRNRFIEVRPQGLDSRLLSIRGPCTLRQGSSWRAWRSAFRPRPL